MPANKALSRQERRAQKQKAALEKSHKQFAKVPATAIQKIVPNSALAVQPSKTIPITALTIHERLFRWTKDFADLEGSWSWGQVRLWSSNIWKKELKPFLIAYQQKTWGEILKERAGTKDGRKYVSYQLHQIKLEAKNRLKQLGYQTVKEVSRFRLGNEKRLYGMQVEHRFRVLWWDPEHRIYGS